MTIVVPVVATRDQLAGGDGASRRGCCPLEPGRVGAPDGEHGTRGADGELLARAEARPDEELPGSGELEVQHGPEVLQGTHARARALVDLVGRGEGRLDGSSGDAAPAAPDRDPVVEAHETIPVVGTCSPQIQSASCNVPVSPETADRMRDF